MVSWDVTQREANQILQIADAVKPKLGSIAYDKRDLVMDLTACHANGCPLDFDAMITAPDFDLIHDILGIRNHLNRRTGKLMNHFWPSMAVKA